MEILGVLDTAERASRGEASVLGRHAAALKVVLEQRDVRRDFAREPVVGSAGEDGVEDPQGKPFDDW
jgi:hypothetical protein